MKRVVGFICLLVASVSLAVACGDDGGGGGTRSVALEQLPQEYADTLCERVLNCCDEQERAEMLADLGVTNEEECAPKLQQAFGQELQQLQDAVAAGRAKYHADKAGECIGSLADAACDGGLFPEGSQSDACDETFEGLVDEGGECWESEECKVGSCEDRARDENGDVTGPGTCKGPGAVGAECEWSDQCQEGLYCNSSYDSESGEFVGECQEIGQAGDSCDGGSSEACAEGLYCHEETGESAGTCTEIGDEGDACSGYGSCVETAYCETYNPETGEMPNVCKAKKGAGEGCEFGQCNESTYCKENPEGTDSDYYGTCTERTADGEPCTEHQQCQSGWCDTAENGSSTETVCQPSGGSSSNTCDGA